MMALLCGMRIGLSALRCNVTHIDRSIDKLTDLLLDYTLDIVLPIIKSLENDDKNA
jgi:hypothetical protein